MHLAASEMNASILHRWVIPILVRVKTRKDHNGCEWNDTASNMEDHKLHTT